MKKQLVLLVLCGFWEAASAQAADGDVARGAGLFSSKCGACHALDRNRVGPKLAGIFGHKAAVVPDYSYSPALRTSGLTWDAPTLDRWLAGAGAMVSGTKMSMRIDNLQDRADIIAYLKSLSAK